MKITRHVAVEGEKAFVQEASRRAYEALVLRVFGQWDAPLQSARFDEKWAQSGFEVIEAEGQNAGAIWVTDEGDYLRLREIFLLPEFQGYGIGSQLITQELRRAQAQSKPLRLRVHESNRARELYRRLGFRVREKTDNKLWLESTSQ